MISDSDKEILNKIKIENIVWIIYIGLIFLCLYGNKIEKHFILFKDTYSKTKYRNITITIFTIAIIIYLYFFFDGYKDIKNLNYNDSIKKKNLSKLNFLGSTLILISGLIFLYIAIIDQDLEIELAFN